MAPRLNASGTVESVRLRRVHLFKGCPNTPALCARLHTSSASYPFINSWGVEEGRESAETHLHLPIYAADIKPAEPNTYMSLRHLHTSLDVQLRPTLISQGAQSNTAPCWPLEQRPPACLDRTCRLKVQLLSWIKAQTISTLPLMCFIM